MAVRKNKGVFVQQITIAADYETCKGENIVKIQRRSYLEFFSVDAPIKKGPLTSVPTVYDYSSLTWDSPTRTSFEGTRGWVENDRLIRFYCVTKRDNAKPNVKPKEGYIYEDEVPTNKIDDPPFAGAEGYRFDPNNPPDFWRRSMGKAGEAATGWILNWDCCCAAKHVNQYLDPPVPQTP